MKLVTFETGNGLQRAGALFDNDSKIADLAAGLKAKTENERPDLTSIQSLIEGGEKALTAAKEVLEFVTEKQPDGTWIKQTEVMLLAPIPQPIQMRDFLCFPEHLINTLKISEMMGEEVDTSMFDTMKELPIYYKCNRFSIGNPDQDIEWPDYAAMMDYEMEFAAIIGKKGKNIPRDMARDYIFGYTIFNDMSARDYQVFEMKGMLGPGKSKDFDNGTVLGPCIVTSDEIDQDNVNMTVRINGTEVSRGNSRDMYHKFEDCISYVSRNETLYPGEVIASGTVGLGSGIERLSLLKENDLIELEVDGIGVLRNRIVAGSKYSNPQRIVQDPALQGKWSNCRHSGFTFEKGLQEIAQGIYAWLTPDGSWGFSNAGLIVDDGHSLLVDTLYDVPRTKEMLDIMAKTEPAASNIKMVVNTHGDGDHWFGNELVNDAEIIATSAAVEGMQEMNPMKFAMLLGIAQGTPSRLGRFFEKTHGHFDFNGINATLPTRKVDERTTVKVGNRTVELIPVGPAHTEGDLLVYLPEANVLFAGDIVFSEGTPVVHAGPVSNYIEALKLILDLEVDVIVPGHGPITDKRAVEGLIEYLELIYSETQKSYEAGLGMMKTAQKIDLGAFRSWHCPERLFFNVAAIYHELSGKKMGTIPKFFQMAELGDF